MASFQNTKYTDTINALTTGYENRLDNPYYNFIDKKPFVVQYYNINKGHTTLDEATRTPYTDIGDDSPIKYNLIKDAVLYGTSRLEVDLNQGDFGLESEGLESESFVLPNSWIPYPGDFFVIDHAKGRYLFKVNDVNIDTFDNGANFYKINWKYDRITDEDLQGQVQETWKFIMGNQGTNLSLVVREETFDLAKKLDDYSIALKNYFKSLFYDHGVQTFIYEYNGFLIYDPYMIEFLRRNNILSGTDYIYIGHQIPLEKTFPIDYNRTFMRSLEKKDKNKLGVGASGAVLIDDYASLFTSRYEDYYCVDYAKGSPFKYPVETLLPQLVSNITNNVEFTEPNMKFLNIIVRYYNNEPMFNDIEELIDNMDLLPNSISFYHIPAVIYILDNHVRDIMGATSK